jgi:ketosteroid isomerase-like protein
VSANLHLVRSIYADWERGDFRRVDWADPEIEYVFADGPDPGSRAGLAAMAEAWRDRLGTSEDLRLQVDDYREVDGERVLVCFHGSGRGKRSGLELGQPARQAASLFQVCDGRVVRLVFYWDRDSALADLGLAPEGDSP